MGGQASIAVPAPTKRAAPRRLSGIATDGITARAVGPGRHRRTAMRSSRSIFSSTAHDKRPDVRRPASQRSTAAAMRVSTLTGASGPARRVPTGVAATRRAPRTVPASADHWPRSRSIRRFRCHATRSSLVEDSATAGLAEPRVAPPQPVHGLRPEQRRERRELFGPSRRRAGLAFRVLGSVCHGTSGIDRGIGLFRNSSVRARR